MAPRPAGRVGSVPCSRPVERDGSTGRHSYAARSSSQHAPGIASKPPPANCRRRQRRRQSHDQRLGAASALISHRSNPAPREREGWQTRVSTSSARLCTPLQNTPFNRRASIEASCADDWNCLALRISWKHVNDARRYRRASDMERAADFKQRPIPLHAATILYQRNAKRT